MKRVLSLILVLALVLGMVPAGFAADKTAGEQLKELGLVKGDTNGNLNETSDITRAEMMVVLARLLGKFDEASKYSIPSTSTDVKGHWAAAYIAFAEKEAWTAGKGNGLFAPNDKVTVQEAAMFMLKALKYTTVTFDKAVEEATKLGILKGVTATTGNAPRGVVFTAALNTLNTAVSGGTTTLGVQLGVLKAPVVVAPTSVDMSSAVAMNSKVVQVTLATAATAVDAKMFTVTDAAGAALNVTAAKLAPYSTANKTVLVTLEKDTTAGTLYAIKSGEKSVNFGGRAADTTKPAIATSGVASASFGEVTVTFTETVDITDAKFAITEKYGAKTALEITKVTHSSGTKVTLATADQKASTLYGITVEGVKDLAGNTMTKDEAQTFVGTARSTAAIKVTGAASNNADEAVVEFSLNIDTTTIAAANFTVEEMYGAKAKLAVTEARLSTTDDTDKANGALTSTTVKKNVILTVPGLKDSTLYKVTAANIKSLDGTSLSTTAAETYTSFVGIAKPTTVVTFAATPVTVNSNTEILVSFARKMDKTLAETVANYTIAEAYGTKAALAVTKAELQSNGKDVKLTVASMKTVLYNITAANLKDIYGNANKTESSANVTSFAGIAVAAKITKVDAITRTAPVGYTGTFDADTQIVVDFDANVGTNATDVSFYSVDNSVGYPTSVKTVDGTNNGDKVILTIGKTTSGKVLKLTVKKGLLNSDAVASTDDVTLTFTGQGNSATLPAVQAVVTTDDHTIKIYFDRDVAGTDVKGKIWSGTTLVAGKLEYKTASGAYGALEALTEYVYQDPDNTSVLVLRSNAASFDTSVASTFYIKNANTSFLHSDFTELQFAGNATDMTSPKIDAVQALDKNTVVVYFNEAMADFSPGVTNITINTKEDGTGTAVAVTSSIYIDSKTVKLQVGDMSNVTYFLKVTSSDAGDADTTIAGYTDQSTFAQLKSTTSSTTAADYAAYQFAGSNTTPTKITNISAMMVDARTIEVYFPEAMAGGDANVATNASAVANYAIYTDEGVTVTAAQPKVALYDAATNKVTLKLDAALTGGTSGIYYVAVDSDVKTESLSNTVKDDKTITIGTGKGVVKQFAASTTANAKPKISSVVASSDNTKLTVTFDQAVAFGDSTAATAYITGTNNVALNEFGANSTGTLTYTPSTLTFATYFTMTGTDKDDAAVTAPILAKRLSNTKVELTFAKAFKANTSGTIAIKAAQATTDTIFNMSKTLIEVGASDIQTMPFGVGTATADVTAPYLVSATYLDTNNNGAVDAVALKFNEALKATASQTATASDFTWVANGITASALTGAGTGTVVGDTITFALSTPGNANITGGAAPTILYTNNAGAGIGIFDAAGNEAATFAAAVTVADGAAPVLVSLAATQSATAATFTFSENVVTATGGITTGLAVSGAQAGAATLVTVAQDLVAGATLVAVADGNFAAGDGTDVVTITPNAAAAAKILDASGNSLNITSVTSVTDTDITD